MISFDQVLLLQEKVESAVQKIVELKAENDALRSKCSELTNALSEKTELLNTLQADEQKIESSILGALNKLNAIENSIVSEVTNSSVLSTNDTTDESHSNKSPTSNQQTFNSNLSESQAIDNSSTTNSVSDNSLSDTSLQEDKQESSKDNLTDSNLDSSFNNFSSQNTQEESPNNSSTQDSLFNTEDSINEPEFDDDDSTEIKKYDIF
mgnify:FL=1